MLVTSPNADDRMTMSDVARLAGVRRPVVTVWRKRYAGSERPFPAPVDLVRGVERFARDEIVGWLVATGRGSNRTLAGEFLLHREPPLATRAGLALAESLVALAGLTGENLTDLDPDDMRALADEFDPHDRCLASEVDNAHDNDTARLAAYLDALLNASYGAVDALERMRRDAERLAFGVEPRVLPEDRSRLCLRLAEALADSLLADATHPADRESQGAAAAPGSVPVIDPTGCCEVLGCLTDETWPDHVLLPVPSYPVGGKDAAKTWASRALWRRLAAARVDARPLEGGLADARGPAVVIAGFPLPGEPRNDEETVLEAVDGVVRALREDQRAVIIGPAAELVDAGPSSRSRDYLLRKGVIRAAIRLPAGGRGGRPQADLALWVLGVPRRAQSAAHRRTAIADLAGLSLAEVADDLIADIIAAVDDRGVEGRGEPPAGQVRESWAHVFRVARYELTSDVLGESRPALVPRGARAAPRIARAVTPQVDVIRPDLPGLAIRLDRTDPSLNAGALATVAELERAGQLRVVPGVRLAHGLARGDVTGPRVIGAPELRDSSTLGRRRVDLLAFAAAHPHAALTNPGDVVFVTSPEMIAYVDAEGSGVVEYPARALRVVPKQPRPDGMPAPEPAQQILPRVLASDLARAPGKAWRSAVIRLIPTEAAEPLAATLAAASTARDVALARARDLDALADQLADGVVAGQFITLLDRTTSEGH